MAISNELMLAILAMDAYNRGYNAGINLPANSTAIGNATIRTDILLPAGSETASFYAQSYTYNSQTVISYRGTDKFLDDVGTGYPIGAGIASSIQGNMALDFYRQVAELRGHDLICIIHSFMRNAITGT